MALEKTIRIKVDASGAKNTFVELNQAETNLNQTTVTLNKTYNITHKTLNKVDKSIRTTNNSVKKTTTSINKLNAKTTQTAVTFNSLGKNAKEGFGKLRNSVAAVSAALGTAVVFQYADAFTSIQNTIGLTTNSTAELTVRTAELLDVANRSRASFEATSSLYQTLDLSLKELNLTTEQTLRLTETITKSFSILGKGTAASAGAITQLQQAFASGVLRGEEFNSLSEQAPELQAALRRSLNLTQGELRKFAEQGGLTSRVLVKAFTEASEGIDKKLAKSTKTLAQSFVVAKNNAIAFVGANEQVKSVTGSLGESLITVSENLDNLVLSASALALVYGSRLIGQIVAATSAKIASATAAIGLVKAEQLEAAAALEVAAANQIAAAKIAGTSITSQQGIVDSTKLAVANTALAAATARVATANTAFTKTATVAGRAAGLLRSGMALLGGPAGLIALAATSLVFFIATADDGIRPTKELASEVDELALSFGKLNEAQIGVKLKNATTEANRLESALLKASIKLNEALASPLAGTSLGGSQVALDKMKQTVADLELELQGAIIKRDALFKAGLSVGRTPQTGEAPIAKPAKELSKKDSTFLTREVERTEALKIELNERLELQRAFNTLILSDQASTAEQERAIVEFNLASELAGLQRKREESALDFAIRKEQAIINGQDNFAFQVELQQQQINQDKIFEVEKTEIQAAASEERILIAKNEAKSKRDLSITFANQFLAIDAAFGSKSEKANKSRQKRQARVNGAAGIVRAWADLPFYAAIGATIAIAASTEAQIRNMDNAGSGGGGGGGVSASGIDSTGGLGSAQRQDPINATPAIEFKGLAEVAEALRDRDPEDVIPIEFVERILSGISEFERIGGG